jgi:hypothetical protein
VAGSSRQSFYDTITEAVRDFSQNGYDSQVRLDFWLGKIREAAVSALTPPHVLEEGLQQFLRSAYRRMVDQGQIVKFHPGVARFTIEKVRPQLRAELDRRIMASANLIKLNRQAAVEKTLQRFSGWATSIPKGGSEAVDKVETKTDIRKSMAQLPYEERRVLVDQGHKFVASLSETIAKDNAAIAGIWHSHYRQAGYRYRPDHKERDGQVYLLRDSWALNAGLIKAGPAGYYDQITHVGEEPFCRCFMTWIYALRSLPDDMLTAKGRMELNRTRVA